MLPLIQLKMLPAEAPQSKPKARIASSRLIHVITWKLVLRVLWVTVYTNVKSLITSCSLILK